MKYKKKLFMSTQVIILFFVILYFIDTKRQEKSNYTLLETLLIKGKEDDEAWLSSLHQIDFSLQNDIKTWMQKLDEKMQTNAIWKQTKGIPGRDMMEKYFLEDKPLPIQFSDRHEVLREPMDELSKLYAKGKICLSNAALARENSAQSSWFNTTSISYNCRIEAVKWLIDEIMLAQNSLLALEQLDQFLDSFSLFSSVGEAAIWAEFSSQRDRFYLFLFIKNRLSNEKINTWLDEKPKFFQAFYQGIISERKLHWEPLAQDLLKGNTDPFDFKHDSYKGLAAILQALHCKERVFAKINSPVEIVEVKKLLKEGGLFSERCSFCIAENEDVLEIMALEARHRMARLLVKTVQLSGQLPKHEEELRELLGPHAKMLDASDSELPIRYEKVHNDRIRFYIPDDLGLLNVLKDRERSGKLRPKGSDNSPLPLQDWAYELQVKFEW